MASKPYYFLEPYPIIFYIPYYLKIYPIIFMTLLFLKIKFVRQLWTTIQFLNLYPIIFWRLYYFGLTLLFFLWHPIIFSWPYYFCFDPYYFEIIGGWTTTDVALPVRIPTGTSRQENQSHTRWGHLINAKYHPTPVRPPLAVPPQERGNSAKE